MKRFVFIMFTLLLPVAGLVILEGVLRIFIPGKPPEMIRRLGEVDGRSFMLFDRTGPASFFGPQAHRMSPAEIVGFYLPKPANTVRIILTGESAMRGFPQPAAFSAASILEAMLRDDYPDKDIEVLNFSATAIASFPVMKITQAALACEPDLIITMAGHNEFFGAYGVVSTRYLGSNAKYYELDYRLRHTAIGRLIGKSFSYIKKNNGGEKQLMEMMAGADSVPYGSEMRFEANDNFNRHVTELAQSCRRAGIPLILCVPPGNETDLFPIGRDEDSGTVNGRTARESFLAAKELQGAGNFADAEILYIDARNRDAMPWRASSDIQLIIKNMAEITGSNLCDVDQAFRDEAGDQGIGWNLMDDHVHPNIDGQVVFAEAMRKSVWGVLDSTHVRADNNKTPSDYLEQLGDNVYDRFSVSATMYRLFEIPFLSESNPDAQKYFNDKTRGLIEQIPNTVHNAVRRWEQIPALSIGKRPLSGLAAMEWLRTGNSKEAIPLLETALKSVPPYSSWSIEYTYYLLASIKSDAGELSDKEIEIGLTALERGNILLPLGDSPSGQTERFMGRILQVLNRPAEAIPFLKQARTKLLGMEHIANDRALIEALRETGRSDEADVLIDDAVKADPAVAPYYR